ncbi:glycosyltransferase [Prevotella sp. E2-28]|uniref:glycosyltransferase n=1 Tax=Prevotella sp. E2-28 TaxID=2913620 RepID=UPI001EDA0C06|nr:glycosyltransferase [Prevotella sp. E2-28]UKK52975.1 glycosyltransferase [Prevotella sp. E2-28]
MTVIIILNWNGAGDTIDCLRSLFKAEGDFFVVIADNGSSDYSTEEIVDYLHHNGVHYSVLQYGEKLATKPQRGDVILYSLNENLGFARGNNEVLRLLFHIGTFDYYLLLNNDTVVDATFLSRLSDFARIHPEADAMTPLICYYSDPQKIWNAGGRQFWGFRKYFFAKRDKSQLQLSGYKKVTFLTGCALFFTPSILMPDGSLLTERFFFGEEDFELCLRMNAAKKNMACVYDSVIYHKVSMSVTNMPSIGRIYIYYLNRFIDMRLHISKVKYACWSRLYSVYVIVLLRKKGITSWRESEHFVKLILRQSVLKDSVTATDFLKAQQCSSVAELKKMQFL